MKKAIQNMKKDESGVSPIVATLVLIVVAVVGAVAVGTIMGTFSSDVSKQTNSGDASAASSTEVIIAGSTTVQPASELLAKQYMKDHTGIKITVQGGGSGAGVAAIGNKIVDIGSASRHVNDAEKTSFPDLVEYQIGGSGVVFAANLPAAINAYTGVTHDALVRMYETANADGKVGIAAPGADVVIQAADVVAVGAGAADLTVVQRFDASGTEGTVAKEYFATNNGVYTFKTDENLDTSKAVPKDGNQGVHDYIKGTAATIGFVDYGYSSDLVLLDVTPSGDAVGDVKDPSATNVKAAVKDALKGLTPTAYPGGLARPLIYITNGQPTPMVKHYITFAQSPAGSVFVKSAGMFGNADLA